MNWFKLAKFRLNAKRVAYSWQPLRTQAIEIFSNTYAAFGIAARPWTENDDCMLRTYQHLSFVEFMSRHPEYIPREDFQIFAGALLLSMNGEKVASVDQATRLLHDNFPDLVEASMALASRCSQDDPACPNYPLVERLSISLQLMRLNSNQVVAELFRDAGTVNTLQQEKLDLVQT